jgi:hypothetical protein
MTTIDNRTEYEKLWRFPINPVLPKNCIARAGWTLYQNDLGYKYLMFIKSPEDWEKMIKCAKVHRVYWGISVATSGCDYGDKLSGWSKNIGYVEDNPEFVSFRNSNRYSFSEVKPGTVFNEHLDIIGEGYQKPEHYIGDPWYLPEHLGKDCHILT